jgi:N utilization substance protein A
LLSRSHPQMIARLFEMEVPEIAGGTVEIKGVAREAGVRSKVAVHSLQEAVDPVGSLVGRRGVRVQAVMAEIGEEKIDIVLWSEDTKQYIINALSPAKIKEVILDEKNHSALIKVEEDQLSLAIGKAGQNVRLASKLSGWQIEVEKGSHAMGHTEEESEEVAEATDETSAEEAVEKPAEVTEEQPPETPEA